jgi:hypothetical protein
MIYFSIAIVFISVLIYDMVRRYLKIKYPKTEDDILKRIQELEVRTTSLEFKRMNEKGKI